MRARRSALHHVAKVCQALLGESVERRLQVLFLLQLVIDTLGIRTEGHVTEAIRLKLAQVRGIVRMSKRKTVRVLELGGGPLDVAQRAPAAVSSLKRTVDGDERSTRAGTPVVDERMDVCEVLRVVGPVRSDRTVVS
ncbi:hypothetical protein OG342_00345 [Streptomyces bobili]|uniref:hypothetical protein n=1 Tax=Streptomyces TaxID=1883 RepID=UPI00224EA332|nr:MULTISPECIES: hypothetical protein [Streptomyces]MCX5521346.1 hypothetical protein [Streptomyces bobili]MDX3570975.1 hypothetical protein [Streptomyces sp. ID05-47C]